jgi:acyl carrier protein
VDSVRADGEHIRTVVHAAGITRQVTLADSDSNGFADIMAAKVAGATHLDELFADGSLDAFVLFSSAAGVWGGAAQGAYAAGNAYLDALAQHRAARGLAATSVAWGGWAGAGMADGAAQEQLHRRGLRGMAPDMGVAALVQAVERAETCLTVADVDWQRFAPAYAMARPRPLIGDIPEAAAALATVPVEAGASGVRERLASANSAGQRRMLLDLVRAAAARVLGHPSADHIDPDRAFRDMGFDSVMAVELRNRIAAETGLALPATLVFDEPSPATLADRLRADLVADTDDGQRSAAPEPEAPGGEDQVAAIQSMDVQELIRMAMKGGDA